MEAKKSLPSTSLKEAFLAKYPKRGIILQYFEEANQCPATWENLTKIRINNFVEYLSGRIAKNSINQYCTKLKAVVNLYNEEFELPKSTVQALSPRKEVSQNIYLTEKELKKFMDYAPKSHNEMLVQAQFAIGALTLARHSDFITFTRANIRGNKLVYTSRKTKIQATVPANKRLLEFIDTQAILLKAGVKVADTTFNRILRDICRKCRINEDTEIYHGGKYVTAPKWKLVSSHTARRSGATNLYLRGLDLLTISKLAGHTNTAMTTRYICCGMRELPKEAEEYFSTLGE
jgi:integrase